MVSIDVGLHCDGCKSTFGNATTRHFNVISRRHIESARERAARAGWRRLQVRKTGLRGDYCPECAGAILEARAPGKGPP